jgi:hypothetical protein
LSPVAWIDAGDTGSYNTSGSILSSVTDKAGTYTMSIGDNPTVITNGLNSLNVFDFNGSNQYLQSTLYRPQVSSGNHWAQQKEIMQYHQVVVVQIHGQVN